MNSPAVSLRAHRPVFARRFWAFAILAAGAVGLSAAERSVVEPASHRQLAFPSAEGYGRFAQGGRGGRVIAVTNLNDTGPGSLRAAVEAEGPRTVVFNVSGRIVLQSKLIVRQGNSQLTVAGQTAPGLGICISNYNFGMLGARDVIIRYVRVRPGNTSGTTLDGMGMASASPSPTRALRTRRRASWRSVRWPKWADGGTSAPSRS